MGFVGIQRSFALVMFKDGFHWIDTSFLAILS